MAIEAKFQILIAALSVYDEIGGLQQFNQRLVAAVTKAEAKLAIGKIVVISLRDHVSRQPTAGVTFIPCKGNRLKFVATFVRHLWRSDPAVVLVAHVKLATLSALARWLQPTSATTLFVHGIEVWNSQEFRARPRFEPRIIRRYMNSIISVSQFTEDIMKREYKLPGRMFRRLYNAIDSVGSVVQKDHADDCVDTRRSRHLLSVSRLEEPHKGIGQVIRAVAQLRKTMPEIIYTVVGEGKLRSQFAAQAEALGVGDIVHFRGELNATELSSAYRDADLFILPSRKEGFGIVFLEAWQHGLPVICGNADASREVVADGESGFIVDPDDIEGMGASIGKLLENPELARRMADCGRKTIQSRFSAKIFEQTLQVHLEELMDESRKRLN